MDGGTGFSLLLLLKGFGDLSRVLGADGWKSQRNCFLGLHFRRFCLECFT